MIFKSIALLFINVIELNYIFTIQLSSDFSERRLPTSGREKTKDRLYQVSSTRIGERVSFQQVLDQEAEDRDRSFAGAVGTTDQDMVSEPANEVQEGQPSA